MSNRDLADEARRRLNEKSLEWASRRKVCWTPDEDFVIVQQWVLIDPADRKEMEIAESLQRTLFSCQGRAEHLRRIMDLAGPTSNRTPEKARPVCDSCHMELPATGVCDDCN